MFSTHCNSHVKSWRNKTNPQIITKNKPFINKYNQERRNFPSFLLSELPLFLQNEKQLELHKNVCEKKIFVI